MRLSQVRLKFNILIRDPQIVTCGDRDVVDDFYVGDLMMVTVAQSLCW